MPSQPASLRKQVPLPPEGWRRSELEVQLEIDLSLELSRTLIARTPTRYERFFKPVVDRIAGLILSVLSLPIVLLAVAAIWTTMGRPAVLTQLRVGRNGHPFKLYKFRTMRFDKRTEQLPFYGPDKRKVHKSRMDPGVTPVGEFLRTWSIDEIPQFWNVARGDMSLVGPRPELLEIVEEKYEPWQHIRHVVKPGMTGIWQISEQREALMYEATAMDLEYLDQVTLMTDLKILLLTVPAALGYRKGF